MKYLKHNLTKLFFTLLYLTLSSPAASATPDVSFGFYPANIDPTTGYEPNWTALTHVANLDWDIAADGSVYGKDQFTTEHNEIIRKQTKSHGVKFMIGAGSGSTSDIDYMLAYHVDDLAQNITDTMNATGAEGVIFDFETPGLFTNTVTGTSNIVLFENMMKTVYNKVKSINSSYSVMLCTPPCFDGNYGIYQNPNLNKYMDAVFVMGYDYNWYTTTGPNSPFYNSTSSYGLRFSINELSQYYGKNKLIYGLPFYGVDYTTTSNKPGAVYSSYDHIFIRDIPKSITRTWDSSSRTPYYVYNDGSTYHQVWYDDNESLALKYQYINEQGILGVGYWGLGQEGSNSNVWNVFARQSDNRSPQVPVASFSGSPISGNVPLTVQFYDKSTNVPTNWQWSFGDGSANSTSQNASHTYVTKGVYTVTLTASNAAGKSTVTRSNYITVSSLIYPTANFTANVTSGVNPLVVKFTDSSKNVTGWYWDFNNDGTNDTTMQNPTYTYNDAGVYSVKLTAVNANGTNSKLATITVSEKGSTVYPVANFSSNVSVGSAPLAVKFTDLSKNATGLSWDFDNNGIIDSTDQNPVNVYATPGVYKVNLTAVNANRIEQVLDNCDSIWSTAYDYHVTRTVDTTNKVEGTGSFKCVATSTGGVYMLLRNTSRWDLSSATYVEANVKAPAGKSMVFRLFSSEDDDYVNYIFTGNGSWQHITIPFKDLYRIGNFNPSSVYDIRIDMIESAVGDTYYVDGITTDAYLNTYDSKLATIIVSEKSSTVLPVANFSSNVSEGYAPLTVQFTDLSKNATGYSWDFGDKTNSTSKNPIHKYSAKGNYTVSLTVTNVAGSNTTIKTNYIKVIAVTKPVANFTSNVTSGTAPLTVSFTDMSTNTPTSWNWSFGDGTYSTVKNPVHTYSTAGNYTVAFTAINTAGSSTVTGIVRVTPPESEDIVAEIEVSNNRLREVSPSIVYKSSSFIDIGGLNNFKYRDVMWFDLSEYTSDFQISNATLSLYWYYPAGSTRPNDTVIEVYRPASSWNSNYVSWNKRVKGVSWKNAGGDWYDKNGVSQGSTPYASLTIKGSTLPDNRYYEMNITDLVKEYASGKYANTGLLIKARTENNNYIAFYSDDCGNESQVPKLQLKYR